MKTMTKRALDSELRRRTGAGEWGAITVAPGLYLDVRSATSAQWRARVTVAGKRRWVSLGPLALFSIDEAAAAASEARRAAREGRDLVAEKRAAAAAAAVPTFGAFAAELVESIEGGFKSERHKAQWRATLGLPRADGHAQPRAAAHAAALAGVPVNEVDVEAVLRVLRPIWAEIPETASRLRGRIERVLDAARARGLRSGDNPARWRGHLDALLPARPKVSRGHHAALPWRDVPAFFAELRGREAPVARTLAFLILTAARSGEVRGARWDEIDERAGVWTVPAARMKAGAAHRVPLSAGARGVLGVRPAGGALVFPSPRGKVLSDMAFAALFRRMGVGGAGSPWPPVTAHGFRSAFRDWCSEAARADFVVAEKCLAHTVGSAVERAYARADLLEQRRALLEQWASYVTSAPR